MAITNIRYDDLLRNNNSNDTNAKCRDTDECLVVVKSNVEQLRYDKGAASANVDGGWGWVIVLAAFSCILLTEGVVNAFGLILLELQKVFQGTLAATASIESLLIAFYFCSGPANGLLINKYGCRPVAMAGSTIAAIGFSAGAYGTSTNISMIFHGVLAGLGFGMIYCSSVVIVGEYFDKKKGLAIGLTMSGSGIGTFIFPPLVRILLDTYGFRGTSLIMGGVLLNGMILGALMRPIHIADRYVAITKQCPEIDLQMATSNDEVRNAKVKMKDSDPAPIGRKNVLAPVLKTISKPVFVLLNASGLRLLKNTSVALLTTSSGISMLGFFIPYVYMPETAQRKGVSSDVAVLLLSIIGITNTIGRILSGILADKIAGSSVWLFSLSLLLSGLSLLFFPLTESIYSMAVISAMFGLFISAYITVTATILLEILSVSQLPRAFGLICFFRGICSTIGPPAAGAVFDGTGSFDLSFYVTGSLMILASIFSFAIKFVPQNTAKKLQEV